MPSEPNKVFFVGAGPGDPKWLTLAGAECLASSSHVFAPPPYEETFAELLAGKEVSVPFAHAFEDLLAKIGQLLLTGHVCFLVPGDLTFYSPFQALVDSLRERAAVIPGVGTANVASAYLKKTLDLPGVCNRTVITSPRTLGDEAGAPELADLAAPGVTLLIYMNNLPLDQLVAALRRGYGSNVPIALLHRLGLAGQEVVQGTLDDICARVGDKDYFNLSSEQRRPALTLVIAGETLTAEVGGEWWNYRYETIWRELA
jgi:precorrin-4/cobalt-precorrin-4 C11-methyltransferase